MVIIFFATAPQILWDLSSLTSDQTHALGSQMQSPHQWTAGEFPVMPFNKLDSLQKIRGNFSMAFQLSETVRPLRLCSQAHKLTASFMGAGRRLKTPRPETMRVITHNTAGSISFMFS